MARSTLFMLCIGALTLALVAPAESPAPRRDEKGNAFMRIVWDLDPEEGTEPLLDWLRDQGWCWGVEIPANAPNARYERVISRGLRCVPQLHAHPDTRTWFWARFRKPVPPLSRLVELARRFPADGPTAQMFMEDDSAGVGFSARLLREKPRTYAAARQMWDRYLEEAMSIVRAYPDLRVWGMAGYARSAHDYARHGIDTIIVERANDDVEDLQTAIAFARGAARQYGKTWGIDLSLWWGVIYGCVPDLDPSLYTRHLWIAWLSGARVLRIEGGMIHYGPSGPGAVARAIDAFGSLARDLDPGTPDVPVAVILAEDHGWMTPPYWRTISTAWSYARIPYRRGDRGIDGFFLYAFPGANYAMDPYPAGAYAVNDPPATPFALSCVTPEFAPRPDDVYNAEPPIPFGRFTSRDEARQVFLSEQRDPSPYRPMGDSRWGDIFDVFTDDVRADALADYRVAVLLGQVFPENQVKRQLADFARSGGTVVVCAGQVTPSDADWCGAVIEPELRVGRAWRWLEEPARHEPFRYCPARAADGAEVWASTLAGDPLVIAAPLGSGRVITVLIPWYEGGFAPLAGVAARLFDHVFDTVRPVAVDGPPAEWLSATGADHRTMLLAHHDGVPWQGTVTLRDVPVAYDACRDLLSGETLSFDRAGSDVRLNLALPPYGVRLIRWYAK